MKWWRNLNIGHNLKSQLLLIFIGLATIPTVILGVLVYNNSASIQRHELNEKLTITSKNWAQITQAYQEQTDKVLKREEALIKQKLVAIATGLQSEFGLQQRLSSATSIKSPNSPVLNNISEVSIGRSGFAFVIDRQGKYLASKGGALNNQFIGDHLSTEDKSKVNDLLVNINKISAAGTYEINYKFIDEAGASPRDQLTVLTYYKPADVIIGVAVITPTFGVMSMKRP